MQVSGTCHRIGVLLVALALITVSLTGTFVSGAAAGTAAEPTIDVSDAETTVNNSTTVTLQLSRAPDGVAGFDLTVALTDDSVATITGVSFDGKYPETNSSIRDGGASAYASAIDFDEAYQDGASDVPLVTITVEGVTTGETSLEVTRTNIDDDDGYDISPALTTGTITVSDGTASDGGSSDGDSTSDGTTDEQNTTQSGGEQGTDEKTTTQTTTVADSTTTVDTTETATTTETTDDASPTETATSTAATTSSTTPRSSDETGIFSPGFGFITPLVALAVLAGGTLFARR